MQKIILIIANLFNILIALGGFSLVAKFSEQDEFNYFTITTIILGFMGLLEGVRAVVVLNFKYLCKAFTTYVLYYSIKLILIPVILFSILIGWKFGFVLGGVVFISSILYFISSIQLALIDSNGGVGYSAVIRTVSWFAFFCSSILSSIYDYDQSYSILYFCISFFILSSINTIKKMEQVFSVSNSFKKEVLIAQQIKDSYKTNLYRVTVDYLDRIYLIFYPGINGVAIYFSRMELAQKIVNFPQLVSVYIYPKLCNFNSDVERNKYFLNVFLCCYLVVYIFVFLLAIFNEIILFYFFHGMVSDFDFIMVLFLSAFLFNSCSFFFVPYLRAKGDFSTPKAAFKVCGFLMAGGIALLLLNKYFHLFEFKEIIWLSIIFLISKLGHVLNFYRCFNFIYQSRVKSILFSMLLVFFNLMVVVFI